MSTIPRASLGACFLLAAALAQAGVLFSRAPASELPDFSTADGGPGRLLFERRALGIGYQARDERWHAQLRANSDAPGLAFDYATLLGEGLGVGARADYKADHAETLVSGILAPDRSLRFRVIAGELRQRGDCDTAGCAGAQNSLMFTGRKHFGDGLISSAGIALFHIADDAARTPAGDGAIDPVLGRMRGYLLDLGLHPTERSRLELKQGQNQLTYYQAGLPPTTSEPSMGSVALSYQLDGCMRLQGRYGAGASTERFDLGLAGGAWSISLARDSSSAEGMSLHAGYTIPLGRSTARRCETASASPFAPLVEAVARRPAQLPRSPLSALDEEEVAAPPPQ
ncbi:hypothetical protein E4K72_08950 [Oxalobacteraceae bacterium OM1]|nr:hypothetical protein E4K72_08950 [Oxalobacteraceae bacterium OM1]